MVAQEHQTRAACVRRSPGRSVARVPATSGAYRTALETMELSRCTHFALAKCQDDARAGCLSSRLSFLLAANPGEGLAEVRVDALRVAERRIEDRLHNGSLLSHVRCRPPSASTHARGVPMLRSPRRFRGLCASVACRPSSSVKWIDTSTHRIAQTNCAAPSSGPLRGSDMTTNGRRQRMIVHHLLRQFMHVNLPQIHKRSSRRSALFFAATR